MATLHLHSVDIEVHTLGPGPACVLWTQGCPLSCRGCMSPETTLAVGGVQARVADVAQWLESRPERHLTLSGGEPTIQAAALADLIDLLGPTWTFTAYSGFDLEVLVRRGAAVTGLLQRLDLLIAGPYVQEQHADLLWRGSTNQVIHDLSGRVVLPADRSAGVEVRMREDALEVVGVPPVPRYAKTMHSALSAHGLKLLSSTSARTFPFPTLEA